MRKKKLSQTIKRSFHKLKYLDKTQASYFAVTSFLLAFCLFTGATYSYFNFSQNLNAATISIAKLSYTLSSSMSDYNNGSITVAAGDTVTLELNLESLNNVETKYALNYSTVDSNVKVYYSENLTNNMTGTIGGRGSNITMRVIIVNTGTADATVNFTVAGGYLQNTLTTNITEGYYEADIIVRAVLLNSDSYTEGVIGKSFPTQDSGYSYVRTQCSEEVTTTWDTENWKLQLDDIDKRVSCDVYFKQLTNDIEVTFALKKSDGTLEYTDSVPNNGTYTFEHVECNSGATSEWDATNWQMNVSNVTEKTFCTGYFNTSGGGGN